tara:strand:- start:352 stop:834 length:483 start_codon:yes stop_codon:yes gene_type:complete
MLILISNFLRISLLFSILTINTSCVYKKIVNGQIPSLDLIKSLEIGRDKKKTVINILGSPSFIGQYDDNSIYYAKIDSKQIAFFDPDIVDQNVLQLEFDINDTLKNVYLFKKKDTINVTMSNQETRTTGKKIGLFEQLIGNLGIPGVGRGPIIGSGRAND